MEENPIAALSSRTFCDDGNALIAVLSNKAVTTHIRFRVLEMLLL